MVSHTLRGGVEQQSARQPLSAGGTVRLQPNLFGLPPSRLVPGKA
ncbi:MAG: hypothetical protein NZM42_13240 [Gemmatales bacterium]|nr:hypothetical protein [Gemmatales bacterium]